MEKHDEMEEFRRIFTPDLYEQVSPNDDDESAFETTLWQRVESLADRSVRGRSLV